MVSYMKGTTYPRKEHVGGTINVCEKGPHTLAYSNLTLPRTLAVLDAWLRNKRKASGK